MYCIIKQETGNNFNRNFENTLNEGRAFQIKMQCIVVEVLLRVDRPDNR